MPNLPVSPQDFPLLQRTIHGRPLVYLDNAATTLQPQSVIDAMQSYYQSHHSNIHRGIHTLAEEATAMYEDARLAVQTFINARTAQEIVFVRNATEAINLVSLSWGMSNLKPGDEIVLTEMEHHANLLPWQRLAKATQAKIVFMPLTDDGQLDMELAAKLITDRTKIVSLCQVSNTLGTINPVAKITQIAHRAGAIVVVDAAQSAPHMAVDVQSLEVDFLAFSGHKMLGPTGIGVLYGRQDLLEQMEPFMLGGSMIKEVSYTAATWQDLPHKFEAGTPHIAGAIGLAKAIEYLQAIGLDAVANHEQKLVAQAMQQLQDIPGLTLFGPNSAIRSGLVSFAVEGVHPHDIASLLDEQGVAVRAGHHCAQPLHRKLGQPASLRASFYLYNTQLDIETLSSTLRQAIARLRA